MFILTHFVNIFLCALYIFRASEIYVRIFSFYGSHPCMLLIVLWLHLIKVHQYVGKSWSCTFFVHDNRYVEVYCLWYENFFFQLFEINCSIFCPNNHLIPTFTSFSLNIYMVGSFFSFFFVTVYVLKILIFFQGHVPSYNTIWFEWILFI